MGVKMSEGVFVPGWNSLFFEELVSMSVVWKKLCETQAPTVTLSPEGAAQTGLWLRGQKTLLLNPINTTKSMLSYTQAKLVTISFSII